MSMTVLSQQEGSIITDNDRKIEALLQLQENSLLRMQNFELVVHKNKMSDYMRGRDFLITELYDEIWVQQQMNEQKTADIKKQSLLIKDLQVVNIEQRQKITRKNKAILILVGIDVAIILGILLVK